MEAESLIFDIDGTLWDSRAILADAFHDALRDCGLRDLSVSAATFRPLFGTPLDALIRAVLPDFSPEEQQRVLARWLVRTDAHLENEAGPEIAYPNIRVTMEALAKKHRLFIVSNGHATYPGICARKLGFDHLIEGSLTFGETQAPKGETIRLLMQQHGIAGAAYIGDTQGDLEATQLAGIPFIWASYGFGAPRRWDAKILDFPELLTILEDET